MYEISEKNVYSKDYTTFKEQYTISYGGTYGNFLVLLLKKIII